MITLRFDKSLADKEAETKSQDQGVSVKAETEETSSPKVKQENNNNNNHDDDDGNEDDDAAVHSVKGEEDGIVAPKLKRSASSLDEDARLAAELHAQWNGGRPSRRGKQVPKTTTPKKKKGRKKSDVMVNPESRKPEKKKRKVNPNSSFNAPLILSEPLSNLLGESQLSRPETVKRIWAYVKERDLQDPDDRRYILCDDSMKPIFGNKIHMLYVLSPPPPVSPHWYWCWYSNAYLPAP